MNRVWPPDEFADERRVFANVSVFKPMHDAGDKFGGKNDNGNLPQDFEKSFHIFSFGWPRDWLGVSFG